MNEPLATTVMRSTIFGLYHGDSELDSEIRPKILQLVRICPGVALWLLALVIMRPGALRASQ